MGATILTKAEADAVEWAFGAMDDYWGAPCEAGAVPAADSESMYHNEYAEVPAGATMPYLDGRVLHLSTWHEINDDLLQRIRDQLPDMADDAASVGGFVTPQAAGKTIALCARLAAKIEEAA